MSKLKADIKFIQQQWEKSTYKIKDNILAQCCVICPEANFSKVGLDKHVKDSCIEIPPEDEENNEEASILVIWIFFSFFFLFCALLAGFDVTDFSRVPSLMELAFN